MTNLTFEERERRAYITGDMHSAELLLLADIGQECDEQLDGERPRDLRERLEGAEANLSRALDENANLLYEIDDLKLSLRAAQEQIAELEAE